MDTAVDPLAPASAAAAPRRDAAPARRPLRVKTIDTQVWYGEPGRAGSCRIRLYEAVGEPPVVVCTQRPHDPGACVSAVVETVAAVVLARHLRHRLEEDVPAVWLEHYPCDPGRLARGAGRLDVARVSFASWRPVIDDFSGRERPRLGPAAWAPLTPEDVAALIGSADPLAMLHAS